MHELTIALSLYEIAQEEAERQGGRVHALHVKVGALSGVVSQALMSSFDLAAADTPLEGSRLVIEEVPVMVYCPTCQAQRPLHSVQAFACSECGTPTGDIRQGKELELVAMEIES